MEEVEASGNADCDVVILPPTSSNLDVSDEEDDDNVLDQDWQPTEVAGEIGVDSTSFEGEEVNRSKHLKLEKPIN